MQVLVYLKTLKYETTYFSSVLVNKKMFKKNTYIEDQNIFHILTK